METWNVFRKVKTRFGLTNQRGFSLIELMVVVAIIGILAVIAIPNYQQFQKRASQSEAKTQLSGMFTAEKSFIAEWGYGSSDSSQIGYALDGGTPLYSTGWEEHGTNAFDAVTAPAAYRGPPAPTGSGVPNQGTTWPSAITANNHAAFGATNTAALCNTYSAQGACTTAGCSWDSVAGTCGGTPNAVMTGGLAVAGTRVNAITFTIGSVGYLGSSNATLVAEDYDAWTIDHGKNLRNTQSGLDK